MSLEDERLAEGAAGEVMAARIEPHPDFTNADAEMQQRIRQWAVDLALGGIHAAQQRTRDRSVQSGGLLADTGAFLDATADPSILKPKTTISKEG